MTAEDLKDKDGSQESYINRKLEVPLSDIGAFIHLFKGVTGTGILYMPFAFKHVGLAFGIIGTILVGLFSTHCVQMLIQASHTLSQRIKKPVLNYKDTARIAFETGPLYLRRFSKTAELLVTVSMFFGPVAISAYVVLIASSVKQLVESFQVESNLDVRLYMAILWVPLAILGTIPELKYLVPVSSIANACIISVYGIVFYYLFDVVNSPTERTIIGNYTNWPLFLGTTTFATESVATTMAVENSMANPKHLVGFPGIYFLTMTTEIFIAAFVGFFGYLRFGDSIEGTITLNLVQVHPNDLAAQACQYVIAAAVFSSFAIEIYPCTATIWAHVKSIFPKTNSVLYKTLVRLTAVTLSVLVAIAIPDLGPLVSFLGAIFPITNYLLPISIDMVIGWSNQPGLTNFRFWKNSTLLIISLCLFFIVIFRTAIAIIDN